VILYHGGLEPILHPVVMKGERVDQLLFHTERSLSLLKYTASMEVSCRAK